mgnify:CR=1 FL=1
MDGPDGSGAARPKLFQPLTIRNLSLKNRLVVPPMVHYRCDPGHTCGAFHLVHLGRYALGGFGLVFVEATAVEEVGLINENDLGIWNQAQAESFKPLIAFMRREGVAIGIQLAHGGRKSSSQTAMQGMGPLTEENLKAGAKQWQPVGPTTEPVAPGWLTPRQLTTAECRAMPAIWANAARNAVLPQIQSFALSIGFIVGGTIVMEMVFSYPGVGKLLLDATNAKDYALMQGVFLVITLSVLVANVLADVAYAFLDPRTRQTEA